MDIEELVTVRLKYVRGAKTVYATIPVIITADDPDMLISLSTVRHTFGLDATTWLAIKAPDRSYQKLQYDTEEQYFVVKAGLTYEVLGVEDGGSLVTPTQSNADCSNITPYSKSVQSVSLVSEEDTPVTQRYDQASTQNDHDDDEDECGTALCSQEVLTSNVFLPLTQIVAKLPGDIDGDVMYGHQTDLVVASTVGKTAWFHTKRPWGHADEGSWSEITNLLKGRYGKILIRKQRCTSDGVCLNKSCPHLLTFDTPRIQMLKGKRKLGSGSSAMETVLCTRCHEEMKVTKCDATMKSVIAEMIPEYGGGNVLICEHKGVHQCHVTPDKGARIYTAMTEQLLSEALPHNRTKGVAAFRYALSLAENNCCYLLGNNWRKE